MDLVAFAAFFIAVIVIAPGGVFLILRLLRPGLQGADLSGVELILIQALKDFVLVEFIFFLIRLRDTAAIAPHFAVLAGSQQPLATPEGPRGVRHSATWRSW
jgi:hypothetical protein